MSPPIKRRVGLPESAQVVTVAVFGVPSERRPLGGDRFHREHLLDLAVYGDAVGVDDRQQRTEPAMRRVRGSLPELSLVELAVADQHDDAAVVPLETNGL